MGFIATQTQPAPMPRFDPSADTLAPQVVTARYPTTAAKRLVSALQAEAVKLGQKPSGVLYFPADDPRSDTVPTVCWEGGPIEWAPNLCAGGGLYGSDKPGLVIDTEQDWEAQALNSYSVAFYS